MATFLCPKCEQPLTGTPNEKNDITCTNPKCKRRWRLLPDHSALMGANTILDVASVKQGTRSPKIGENRNG